MPTLINNDEFWIDAVTAFDPINTDAIALADTVTVPWFVPGSAELADAVFEALHLGMREAFRVANETSFYLHFDVAIQGYRNAAASMGTEWSEAEGRAMAERTAHMSFVDITPRPGMRETLDTLRERGILLRNAPHLVSDLSFIVPSYQWWESPFYGIGLKVYDLLAGRFGFQPSRHLSKASGAPVSRINRWL